MGKTFLCRRVFDRLSSEGFIVAAIEPASPKQMLVDIADALGVETKNLEGRSISADGLKSAIAQFLSTNPAFLIFDDAHLLEAKFRQWLKSLKKLEIPLLLTATNPPRTDIFINLPRIELQPLGDRAIRELMETTAIDRGIDLKPNVFAKLQERAGGNPMLACRIIEEEFLGLENEAGDHTRYFDITPLIVLVGIFFVCLRFIGLGTNDQALYIFGGISSAIFIGFTLAMRSLPKESRRIG
jgi:AAA domain